MLRLLLVLSALLGIGATASAQWTVVNSGTSQSFTAPVAGALNYAWTLDGTAVGSNSRTFTYSPDAYAVGTHALLVAQTLSTGGTSTAQWGVRVRIPIPTSTIQYYVSPTGSGTGSSTSPFGTLEAARDKIRTLGRPLPPGGVTVFLTSGTYWRTSTFTLTGSDSGTSSAPIIYSAAPGASVVISTGTALPSSAWSQLNASQWSRLAPGVSGSNVWETDVSSFKNKGPYPVSYDAWPVRNSLVSTTSVPDVFYNSTRAWLSRYPNHNLADESQTPFMLMNGIALDITGTNYLNTSGTYLTSGSAAVAVGGAFHYYTSGTQSYTVGGDTLNVSGTETAAHIARWTTALSNGGLWLQGFWRVTWQSSVAKVLGIDTGNQVIEFAPGSAPNGGFGNKYASAPPGYGGRPGNGNEPFWVMNLLEEMDQPGEWCIDFSRNKLYFLMDGPGAPPHNSVVIADGTNSVVQISGSNVILQSLTFDKSLGVGVYIPGGSGNLVTGCTFQNMTNMGVYIADGSRNGVVSCNFNEMGAMGIQIGTGTTGASCGNNFVVNTKMTGLSRYAQVYQPGINIPVSKTATVIKTGTNTQNRIAHNYIYDTPQMGVQFDGTQNLYEYNDISKFGWHVDDTSAFYSYQDENGADTFRYNYSHDTPLASAITYDGGDVRLVSGTYYGNISQLDQYCEGSSLGIGLFSQINCVNNMSIGGGRYGSYIFTSGSQSNINNNVAVAGYYPAKDFVWTQVTMVNGTSVYTPTAAEVLANGPNLSYAADPGFLDMNNEDLRLRPDSQVLTDLPNFVPIPFEMIGIYNDEYRSDAPGHTPYVVSSESSPAAGAAFAFTMNGLLAYPQFDANTSVTLYWGPVDSGTNAAGWENFVNLTGTNQPSGPLSYVVTGTTPRQYYYRFKASNPYGTAWSPSAGLAAPPPPDAPTGVTVTPSYAQSVISWNPATYASSYIVRRATSLSGSYVTVGTVDYPATSYTDTGLTTGVTYYYTVTASNGLGSSPASGAVSVVAPPGAAIKADNITSLDQGPSWSLGVTPTPLDNALWNGIYASGSVSVGGGLSAEKIQVSSPSKAITINAGSGGVNLAGSTGTGIDLSAATQNLTINAPVTLGSSQSWTVASGRTLTVNGAIGDGGAGRSLTASGTGTIVLGGTSTFSGGLNITPPSGGLPTYNFGTNNPSAYVKLNANATVGNVTANGRLDILDAATAGTISGSGSAGYILNSGTTNNTLTFAGGSSFSMFNIGADGATVTLQQTGTGGVLFSFFGYKTTAPNAQTTFNGGTWTLNQIGQNNTGAQCSGAFNITGSANVSIPTSTAFSHGTWNVTGGTLQFGGSVSEANGSNIPLNTSLNLNVSGSNSSLAVSGGLTIGDGGSGTNANGLSLSSGSATMTGLTVGTTTGGHNDTNTVNLSGGKLVINGALGSVVSGTTSTDNIITSSGSTTAAIPSASGQRTDLIAGLVITGNPGITDGTTIASISGATITLSAPAIDTGTNATTFTGGSQSNAFNWTGGQLTAATINPGAGFSGTSGSLTSNALIQSAGILAPGDVGAAGKTTINGNYNLGVSGTLAIDMSGTTQATAFQTGQYDYLFVTGSTSLAGGLSVSLRNGFTPTNANSFTVLSSTGTLSGAFSNVAFGQRLIATGSQGSFVVTGTGNKVTLGNYVPLLPATSLTASGSNAAIKLSWAAPASAPAGITYTVSRSSISGGSYAPVTSGTATSYTDNNSGAGLAAGTTCYYVVTGSYGGIFTPNSNEAYATTYTALQSWRLTNFGTILNSGTAADTADPDRDGGPNLLEYALGTDPKSASSRSTPVAGISGGYLTITFTRAASDVSYIVEGSSNLTQWSTIATNPGTVGSPVTVPDNVLVSGTARRFLRLKVTSP